MAEYIPWNDSELKGWLAQYALALADHREMFGLTEEDVTALQESRTAFDEAHDHHFAMQAAAQAATARKKICRDEVVQIVRRLSRQVDNHPEMTNALRASMGLNVKKGGRSASSAGQEAPYLFLETRPGRVIVHFGDTPGNELTNGKPSWARGCNIYRKRDGEDEYRLVAFESSSPYIDKTTGPASGYTYIARYQGKKANEQGGESQSTWIAAGGEMAA